MFEFAIYPKLYIQDDELILEIEDEDGIYISSATLPIIELKEALDALVAQDKPKETV